MADGVNITAGSGVVIASDDVGGFQYQRVKISQGADGSATDVSSAAPLNVTLANTGANATPLVVDLGANNDVTVSGTVAVTQSGTWDEVGINDSGNSITVDNPQLSVVGGGTEAAAMRVTIASDSTGVLSVDDNGGSLTVDGTVTANLAAGTNNIGDVDVLSLPAIPAGTNNIGDVDVLTVNGVAPAFGSGVRGATVQRVTIATDDSVPVTNTGTFAVQLATNTPVGNIAHDSADSGAPIKFGGRARTTEIAAVATDDRTDAVFDKVGKQVMLPYAIPENFVSGAITSAMTGTTSTSLVAAPAGSLRNYLTTIIVSNSHATVGTDVVIQDGSGGTTLMTIPAAALYGGAVITLPTPLRQPTTATAIYCANVTTGASTKVSAVGYTGL